MSSVLDKAQNFSGGVVSAARQRDRWARQEANATDDEAREQYREAVADLEARFPDLEDVPVGGAEAFARERGHGSSSRSPTHEGRRRTRAGGQPRTSAAAGKKTPAPKGNLGAGSKAAKGRKPVAGLDPTARRSSSQKRSAQGRPTPRVDRAIQETRIPATLSGARSTAMAALGATVGLSLGFLVLDSAEKPGTGAAAFPSLVEGATRAVGRFLSLGDVFPSNRRAPAISGGGSRAIVRPTSKERAGAKHLLNQLPELPPPRHRTPAHPIQPPVGGRAK